MFPMEATTEGFGGTYATPGEFQDNEKKLLMKQAGRVGRYIRLCNYCSGLCMPEIAAMGRNGKARCNA
ncbi:MAG: lysine 5,6-aminomutase subunit alpha TIM-barrel domain-containing protein [Lutisporaceae bacterium]